MRALIRHTNSIFMPFLRSSPWLLVVVFFGCEFMHNYFALMGRLTQGTQSLNLAAISGSVLTSLLEFVVFTMLVPLRVLEIERQAPPSSFWAFTQKHVWPLTVESIRALAITLLFSLLFIIPGIFKYVRYLFVPYVVVADPAYEKGERDALEHSNELIKGITLPLFLFLLLMGAVEVARSSIREKFPLFFDPFASLLLAAGLFLISLYANLLLFRLYQLRVQGLPPRS